MVENPKPQWTPQHKSEVALIQRKSELVQRKVELSAITTYLPASNPEVWQAKAGSTAAGKMDMLSVLLHEYGHALGLEHSGDASNYMAASLQPAQRKLSRV